MTLRPIRAGRPGHRGPGSAGPLCAEPYRYGV